LEGIVGLVLLGAAGVLVFFYALPQQSRRQWSLRPVAGVRRLRRAIGLAVEDGKRLHISLGRASIIHPSGASALAGLSTLERVAQLSVVSDRPPVATSGDATLAILSQDTLRAAYRGVNALDQYEADRGRLAGPTPFSYAAGTLPVIRGEQISTNVLVGHFGPEVALLCESAEHQRSFLLAASDSLPAQAVMHALAEEPLIGEELFALPAYLQASSMHQASVRTQDVLRWALIAFLVIGAVVKLISTFMGIPIL
jgi:hypothetical protein